MHLLLTLPLCVGLVTAWDYDHQADWPGYCAKKESQNQSPVHIKTEDIDQWTQMM